MRDWKHIAHNLDDLPKIAKDMIATYGKDRIFAFYGDMGAGKTTYIKVLCRLLGVKEEVSSPTFSIVNEYVGKENNIFHFDFYRIENEQEAVDIGAEEYFYSGSYCFIEWAQKIEHLLPEESIKVQIEELSPTQRVFFIANNK